MHTLGPARSPCAPPCSARAAFTATPARPARSSAASAGQCSVQRIGMLGAVCRCHAHAAVARTSGAALFRQPSLAAALAACMRPCIPPCRPAHCLPSLPFPPSPSPSPSRDMFGLDPRGECVRCNDILCGFCQGDYKVCTKCYPGTYLTNKQKCEPVRGGACSLQPAGLYRASRACCPPRSARRACALCLMHAALLPPAAAHGLQGRGPTRRLHRLHTRYAESTGGAR